MTQLDQELAERYGSYASYDDTVAAPAEVDHYGESTPQDEIARLLAPHLTPDSRMLDIGCGAGFTLCRVAPHVGEVWGIDQDTRLLHAASQRADELGLANARLVEANVAVEQELASLPDAFFDVALSQRGPNLNFSLLRCLRPKAVIIQELAVSGDAYPLKEIFGRRTYAPYHETGIDILLHVYGDLGLLPVSVKEFYFDEFYRDAAHLETALRRGMLLAEWRVPSDGTFQAARDQTALDQYVRYFRTPRGIRLSRRRSILVMRRADSAYYPADNEA